MKGDQAPRWRRVFGAIRDGWLMVGMTFCLLLLVECGYRGARGVGRMFGAGVPADSVGAPRNPFDTTAWAREYRRDHLKEEEVRWAPYVYVRNPTFQGTLISTDTAGHRITPVAPTAATSPRTIRVFFFGGSTTFGWYQRNEHTIPAEAARRIATLVGNRAHLEVTNFGIPGHTFTQEMLELLLQLRTGARPDVVVFYDGINDVMATVQNGRAGVPQNEANRAEDFARGRMLADEANPGLRRDLRVAKRVVTTMLGRLQFVRKIVEFKPAPGGGRQPDVDSLANSLAHVFASNARLVEALAAAYHFQPIYVWQPALLSTRKKLTERERWLSGPGRVGEVHRATPPLLRALMPSIAGARFTDATTLFDDDSLEVFVDHYGHTYERANPRVVDTMMTSLEPAIRRALQGPLPAADHRQLGAHGVGGHSPLRELNAPGADLGFVGAAYQLGGHEAQPKTRALQFVPR